MPIFPQGVVPTQQPQPVSSAPQQPVSAAPTTGQLPPPMTAQKVRGMIMPGNIDVKSIPNPKTLSVNIGGKEVLLNAVGPEGTTLSKEQALEQFKATGKHFGVFDSPDAATEYAKTIDPSVGQTAPGMPAPGQMPISQAQPPLSLGMRPAVQQRKTGLPTVNG